MLIAPMWAKSPRLMEIVLLPCSQPWPFLLHRERRDFIISSSAGTPRLTSLAHGRFNLNAVRLVHVIDTIQSAGILTTKSICRWCGKLFQRYLAALLIFFRKCWMRTSQWHQLSTYTKYKFEVLLCPFCATLYFYSTTSQRLTPLVLMFVWQL